MFRIVFAGIVVAMILRPSWFSPFDGVLHQTGSRNDIAQTLSEAHTLAAPVTQLDHALVFVWLTSTLLLPIISLGLLRRVVRQHSNSLNACVLALFVTVDLLGATAVFPIRLTFAAGLIWGALAALVAILTLGSMRLALYLES